jgi:hypothetical protein
MANKTATQVVELARARAAKWGASYLAGLGVLYQRAGIRQRQLYGRANKLNPERFGACLTSALSSGLCDLNDVDQTTVPTPDLIQRIEVSIAGSSGYAVGDQINVVTAHDQAAELAPRCIIRDRVIIGVGSDLTNVTAIKVYYGKMPAPIAATAAGAATVLELEEPWDVLLEVDLAKYITQYSPEVDAAVAGKALAALAAEEAELLADFDAHVIGFAPIVSQYLPPLNSVRAGP